MVSEKLEPCYFNGVKYVPEAELAALKSQLALSTAREAVMREALMHSRVCAVCAEGDWSDCEAGRDAIALIENVSPAAEAMVRVVELARAVVKTTYVDPDTTIEQLEHPPVGKALLLIRYETVRDLNKSISELDALRAVQGGGRGD